MKDKKFIRKKYFLIRKKKYFQVNKDFFNPLIKLMKNIYKNKRINLSMYYPSSYELNLLSLLEIDYIKKCQTLLPIIKENNSMNFFKWKKNDILVVNKYGILEPIKSRLIIPNVILIPLLAFDEKKNRLGYGKGFYDRYLNKFLKINKNIFTIGIAFSFQKYHKLPVNNKDVKLNYVLTEKGII